MERQMKKFLCVLNTLLHHSSLVDYLSQVIYAKKLSHHFLLHFPIGMGSYDHHAKYQGVFP